MKGLRQVVPIGPSVPHILGAIFLVKMERLLRGLAWLGRKEGGGARVGGWHLASPGLRKCPVKETDAWAGKKKWGERDHI